MSKISKEKRNQVVLAVLGIAIVIAGIYMALIRPQLAALSSVRSDKEKADGRLRQILDAGKNADKIAAERAALDTELADKENSMASGDLYSWMIDTVRAFSKQGPYDVEIPQKLRGPESEVNLLPKFPYRQYTISVIGTAYYHDLGKFIADFENRFPTSRILNLELSPSSGQGTDEREKLSFKMEIVSLIQPNATSAKQP